jgi:hypothetical protein
MLAHDTHPGGPMESWTRQHQFAHQSHTGTAMGPGALTGGHGHRRGRRASPGLDDSVAALGITVVIVLTFLLLAHDARDLALAFLLPS